MQNSSVTKTMKVDVSINLTEYRIDGKVFLEKESLKRIATHIHGDKAICVSGKPYFSNNRHEKYQWVKKEVLPKVYSIDKNDNFPEKTYYFTYVKFAIDESGNIFGIQSGKSQIHLKYYSDIYFWNIDSSLYKAKELKNFMQNNHLKWYVDEILIIKTNDYIEDLSEGTKSKCEFEALYNEKNIGWGLFD